MFIFKPSILLTFFKLIFALDKLNGTLIYVQIKSTAKIIHNLLDTVTSDEKEGLNISKRNDGAKKLTRFLYSAF